MFDLVSLGEVMLCLSAPKYKRMRHTTHFDVRVCGAQFNIAANVASLGWRSAFLTALPANEVGQLTKTLCNSYGVNMSHVGWVDDSRMGLIFLEYGALPRAHTHIYDRADSAASTLHSKSFDWASILDGVRYVYCDGILPALNAGCEGAVIALMETAKSSGCTVCFDVNFRESLWQGKDTAAFYRRALASVDILVTGRSFSEDILKYAGDDEEVLRSYKQDYDCEVIILTYRTMPSAKYGTWRSTAFADDELVKGRSFEFDVIDRFGTGDAFFAGFLYGYAAHGTQYGLNFGGALCALAHTIDGDVAHFDAAEVEAILASDNRAVMKR